MAEEPSTDEASEAGKEAHSSDPQTRKKAMETLREKRDDSGSDKANKKDS